MHAKKTVKIRKAVTVTHRNLFVIAQYNPVIKDATIVPRKAMLNRAPTMKKSFSYRTLI